MSTLRYLRNALIQKFVPCRIASTEAEWNAIAKLRYATHIKEQNVALSDADHDGEKLWHPEDEGEDVFHYYAGTQEDILGALRVRIWKPGTVPEVEWNGYSMDVLPDMQKRTICEVAKLVVAPSLRGSAAMAALTSFAVYEVVRTYRNELMVAVCVPGLVRHYEGIGLRHFGGRLLSTKRGVVIPLIGLTNDLDHTYRIGSPWYSALRRLHKEGKLPEELPAYRKQIEEDRSVVTDPQRILKELTGLAESAGSPFLKDVPEDAMPILAAHGMILDVPASLAVCRADVADREVYLVIEGIFEVCRGDQVVAQVGPGQLFGEMAILSKRGQRTATVRSKGAGRVLVLRRKFLAAVAAEDPELGRLTHEAMVQELIRKLQ